MIGAIPGIRAKEHLKGDKGKKYKKILFNHK